MESWVAFFLEGFRTHTQHLSSVVLTRFTFPELKCHAQVAINLCVQGTILIYSNRI